MFSTDCTWMLCKVYVAINPDPKYTLSDGGQEARDESDLKN